MTIRSLLCGPKGSEKISHRTQFEVAVDVRHQIFRQVADAHLSHIFPDNRIRQNQPGAKNDQSGAAEQVEGVLVGRESVLFLLVLTDVHGDSFLELHSDLS